MNKEYKGNISPCELTKDDLAEINRFTVKELKSDEVYSFNVILCDNEIDRDGERFSADALAQLAKLFVGVTGIFDHNPKSANQSARIYSAECVKIPGKRTADGEAYLCVKAKAYIPLTEKNSDLISDINAGIKKEVSVSCAVGSFTCSVCGNDMRHGQCNHIKGKTYGGKLCYCTLSDISDAYEWSFVAVPAQVNAGVTKSYIKEIESMENCIKAIKDGNPVKLGENESRQLAEYIARLEKQAKDGAVYRRSLTEETAKYAALSVPFLSGESIEKMCSSVETEELVKIRDAFRKKAEEVIPLSPQLKAKKDKTAVTNDDFKF